MERRGNTIVQRWPTKDLKKIAKTDDQRLLTAFARQAILQDTSILAFSLPNTTTI
jgi:hypothetical protein